MIYEKNFVRRWMLASSTRLNRKHTRKQDRPKGESIAGSKKYDETVIAEVQNSMEQNDMRRFFETVYGVRRKTAPSPAMCIDREGNLLTDKMMVVKVERALRNVTE